MDLQMASASALIEFLGRVLSTHGREVLEADGTQIVELEGAYFCSTRTPIRVAGPFPSAKESLRTMGQRRYAELSNDSGKEPFFEVVEWQGAFFSLDQGEDAVPRRHADLRSAIKEGEDARVVHAGADRVWSPDDDRFIDEDERLPWTYIDPLGPWRQVAPALVERALNAIPWEELNMLPSISGRVLVPSDPVSVHSALLAGVEDEAARNDTSELELDGITDLETALRQIAEVEQLFECAVENSMVSGAWGLGSFTFGSRGYLYNRPDAGIGDDESLPILGAWEPADDPDTRLECIKAVYRREATRKGWPPHGFAERIQGDTNLIFDLLVDILLFEPDVAGLMIERLRASPEFEKLTVFDMERAATRRPLATRRQLQELYELTRSDPRVARDWVADRYERDNRMLLLAVLFLAVVER
ncbi:MAG: hypothetical protein WD942_11255 [Dehalococcoidia bacterium]